MKRGINSRGKNGLTPLQSSLLAGNVDLKKMWQLLEDGANSEAKSTAQNYDKRTALQIAKTEFNFENEQWTQRILEEGEGVQESDRKLNLERAICILEKTKKSPLGRLFSRKTNNASILQKAVKSHEKPVQTIELLLTDVTQERMNCWLRKVFLPLRFLKVRNVSYLLQKNGMEMQ